MKVKILLSTLALLCLIVQMNAQTLDKKFASTNAPVFATLQSGDTAYIGGSFTQVGVGTKGLARFSPGNTKPDVNFPQLGGTDYCYSVAPDGSGGTYLGGYFNTYNGNPITPTAVLHILSDGSMDPGFATVDDGGSYSIGALRKRGNRLYIGGGFLTINGSSRPYVAALNATTGALDSWTPDAPNSSVTKIEANDSLVFLTGNFIYVGGAYQPFQFATLKASSGKLETSFPNGNSVVTGFKVDSTTLYMGGPFTNVGHYAQGLAKVSNTTASQDPAYPYTDGNVFAILPDGSGGFFVGGVFTTIGNTSRSYLAHILSSGVVDPAFNVTLDGGVNCLTTDGTNLYIGGGFTTVNGTTRNYAASVVIATGATTTFNPNANSPVYAIAYYGGTVYLGGSFTTMKGSSRNYVAAVTTANVLTAWAPNTDSYVFKIVLNNTGTSAFISGYFTTVKGASFPYLAKVNTTNGNTFSWKPNPNGVVFNLVLNGSVIYAKGSFNTMNGITRYYFAAIDTTGNNPTSLRADMDTYDDGQYGMYLNGTKLYIAGNFNTIQDSARKRAARLDLSSGLIDSWNATSTFSPDNVVYAVSGSGSNVVLGGSFSFLSIAARNHIAAVDLTNTSYPLRNWQPDVANFGSGYIYDIQRNGNDIYASGQFSYDTSTTTGTPSGVTMYNVIALNDSTGKISHQFTQYPDGAATSMAFFDNKLMIQGTFTNFYKIFDGSIEATKHYLAGYNLSNYQLSPAVYEPNAYLNGMSTDGSGNLVTGGTFTLMNYVDRQFLAAININTGLPTSWNPSPNSTVYSLAAKDTSIFVGGTFSTIGTNALTRNFLAAVGKNSGKATTWAANCDNQVYSIAVKDTVLYVGGAFTTIKGSSRNYGAAVTTNTATVLGWAPNPNSYINTVLPLNNYVYIGGYFTTVKGTTRNYLAKTAASNGNLVTSWNPNPDSYIYSLTSSGNTVFAGGSFSTISTKPRIALAAYDTATNALTNFDANINNGVFGTTIYSLAAFGKQLFLGSSTNFTSIGTTNRGYLAGLDTATKAALAFDPMPDAPFNGTYQFYTGKNKLFAGGPWLSLGTNVSPSYFGVFTLEPQTQASSLTFTNVQPQSVTANWTNGSGEARIAIGKQGATPNTPDDGKAYTANASFGSGQTTGAQSYTVANGTANTANVTNLLPNHSYTFSVFEYNGSGTGSDYQQSPALTGSITTPCPVYTLTVDTSGPLALCPGGNVTLTAPAGFSSYLWSNSATTQSITVSAAGTYSVTFTDSNGCAGNASRTVSIKTVTAPVISPATLAICQGSSGTLTASAGYSNYLWSTSATTQAISVNAAGSYTVTATQNATGCTATSAAATVSINPLPNVNITAGGPTTFCQGGSVTLTADGGFSAYLWSNGATTQSTTVGAAGNYTCNATNANGCTGTSNSITVTVNAVPAKPTITANGSTTNVCPGKTVTLTSSGGSTYLWNTGATTQSIVVNAAGNYSVRVGNGTCVSVFSDPTAVTYATCGKATNLATSNITATAAKLSWSAVTCAVGYQYEWRKKGTTAWTTGQTNLVNKTITGLTAATTYQWRVITACKISPDTLVGGYATGPEFTTLGAAFASDDTPGSLDVKLNNPGMKAIVMPNPANSIATVNVTGATGKLYIRLTDLSGKALWLKESVSESTFAIDVSRLAQGTYMITVKDDKETKVMKLIRE